MPGRALEFADWLRTGMASGNRDRATGALSGLGTWLRLSNSADSPAVVLPEDLLRQLGLVIAVRKREVLSVALQVAKQLFDEGSYDSQEIVLSYILEGLGYLAKELRYDSESEKGDISHLRLRCAQLASSMSRAGFGNLPEVMSWLELASSDPFPENYNM